MIPTTAVHILYRNDEGDIDDLREEYDLSDLGGVLPL